MTVQLSRHLQVGFDAGSSLLTMGRGAKYLLGNALRHTRIVGGDEIWEMLSQYEKPRALGDSPLEARAAAAGVLWPTEETGVDSEYLNGFQQVASKFLGYRKVEPADTILGLLEQLREACRPLKGFESSSHYLFQDPKRLFGVMLDHVGIYAQTEVGTPQVGDLKADFIRESLGRPERNGEFAQQPCMLASTSAKAERVAANLTPGSRVLVLGDDDLLSLALPAYSQCQVDTFEIDRVLVRFLKKKCGPSVRILCRDLSKGLPEEYRHCYDAVIVDPAYDGLEWFAQCCADGLKKSPEARLYLTTQPRLLARPEEFEPTLERLGLKRKGVVENFTRYLLPSDTHRLTSKILLELGYHPKLVRSLMQVPYLYANLYELAPDLD